MAIFAKYDGIDGESKDENHDTWIDVLELDWSVQRPERGVSGHARRRGAVVVEDMSLTIEYEKAAPKLLEKCAREGLGVFFLGSDSETLREAAEKLRADLPGIDIRGWHAPPFGPVSEWDHAEILKKLDEGRPDLVLVATGSPKQEQWIVENANKLNVKIIQGVGGTLDTITGHVKRAPQIMQKLNLEWLYRLITNPKRFKRQMVLPVFAFKIMLAKFGFKTN